MSTSSSSLKSDGRVVEINGSHGEGGGALLRTALALSCLTQQAVRIHKIRGALRRTGLTGEDLTTVQALAATVGTDVSESGPGDEVLEFVPQHSIRPLRARLDIQSHEKGATPGSAIIVLQSLLAVLSQAGGLSRIAVQGETHNAGTITYDALEKVTLPLHRAVGLYAFPSLVEAGFGFAARGEAVMEVEPSRLEALDWQTRGELRSLRSTVCHQGVEKESVQFVGDRIQRLMGERGFEIQVETVEAPSRTVGLCATLTASFDRGLGSGTASFSRGVRMEEIPEIAVKNLMDWLGTEATLDAYLADQILLCAAFAEGRTVITTPQVTRRLITMAWVIKQFMPIKATILGREGEPGTVTIER